MPAHLSNVDGPSVSAFRRSSRLTLAYLRFEREGKWVGALIGYALLTKVRGLNDIHLGRVKSAPCGRRRSSRC